MAHPKQQEEFRRNQGGNDPKQPHKQPDHRQSQKFERDQDRQPAPRNPPIDDEDDEAQEAQRKSGYR